MNISIATVTIVGTSYYSQSRGHDAPKLEGESHDAYDKRTWREKQTVSVINGQKTVVIPAHGMHQAIAAAAKYCKKQIPGQGKATWTAKFTSGIAILEDPSLNTDPETVDCVVISANADGIRGSGKRVTRRFPNVNPGWTTTFDIHILDPIITQDVLHEMLAIAGMFIGVGRFRPQNGGTNGRFRVSSLTWQDNRALVA